MDSARVSWAYLAGFTDGDGHIRVVDPREGRAASGAWVRVGWTQAEANVPVLDAIGEFLERQGVSRFSRNKSVSISGRIFPAVELGVARQDEVYDVLSHLLPHLVLKADAAMRGIEVLELIRSATQRHGRRSWLREVQRVTA